MAVERLYINENYIPLSEGLNPSITKSVKDISEPDKARATYSKSIIVPRSKEADKEFSCAFEINATNLQFNTAAKAPVRYECDSVDIINGYIRLNKIVEQDGLFVGYECTMFNEIADFFSDIKGAYLRDLYETTANYEGLDIFDHPLTKELQQKSWETEVLVNGVLEPFDYGYGYVYALVDYGFSQDATDFIFTQIGCSIYELEYMLRIINWAGYKVQAGGFFDTDTIFDHLIVPSSPECYQLTNTDIVAREFLADTPELDSTGTTQSNNLPIGSFSADDQIIFTNDSVAPAFDSGLNYDPTTGQFEVVSTGVYSLNTVIDINATFTPSGGSVKTICDIHGFIKVFYTPISTGVPVQTDAVPFYITKDDNSFYAGARSTSSTPTYPDDDYMVGKAWGKLSQTAPVGRAVSPPDRYTITVNAAPLNAGDIIEIKWSAGIFCESTIPFVYNSSNFMFEDSIGTKSSGSAYLTMALGEFYNKVVNTTMSEGNTLQMLDVIPDNVKMIDYFKSNMMRFNLIMDVNLENEKELIIKTRDAYLGTEVVNIDKEELLDVSKDVEIIPITSLNVKEYFFTYTPDKDYWNDRYTKQWGGKIYGQRQVPVETEFTETIQTTKVIFSPTPSVGLPSSDRVLPTIYALDGYNQPITTKSNIRSLYYGGLKTCSTGWNHINYVSVFGIPFPTTYVKYPYAGHFDDPFNATFDLNFGLVNEVFYDDNIQDIVITDNNLVNKYWGKFLREITDPEARIVKAYIHLNPLNYAKFTFDKLYYFKFAYFRLLEINDYNPTSEETTLCTFLKVNEATPFTPTVRPPLTGKPEIITPDQTGGNVNLTEQTPAKGSRAADQPNNNNYSSRSATVKGKYNYVNLTAKDIEIYGDSNRIEAEAKNIKIQGSGNKIRAGVENVTLINTNNITVTESYVTYIDGLPQYANNRVVEITADTTADLSVRTYLIDASGASVDLTFDTGTTDFEEGQLFFIKATDVTNVVRVVVSGGTIDGSVAEAISTVNDGIEIQYHDGDFYIVSNKNTSGGGSGLTQPQVEGLE